MRRRSKTAKRIPAPQIARVRVTSKQRRLQPKKGAAESKRVRAIADTLEELYPDAHCELDFGTPFQLLQATILSAQCTDKRVNLVTPTLFARFPDPRAMAAADPQVVQDIIQSTGFYRNKTKSLIGAARVIMEKFGGRVPRTMEALLELPGVARKTANVILGTAFGINEGFVVDTHVARLAGRLKLSRELDPVRIERDLCARFPRERWTQLGHQLIWHGRRVCSARKPDCGHCALAPHCPSAGIV